MSANTPEKSDWPERSFEDTMSTVHFIASPSPHTVVDGDKCLVCSSRECLNACPANLFAFTTDGRMLHNHEHCFECGTCYTICPHGAVAWSYPEGGHGVVYRYS